LTLVNGFLSNTEKSNKYLDGVILQNYITLRGVTSNH